jgi:hypothetical protein
VIEFIGDESSFEGAFWDTLSRDQGHGTVCPTEINGKVVLGVKGRARGLAYTDAALPVASN